MLPDSTPKCQPKPNIIDVLKKVLDPPISATTPLRLVLRPDLRQLVPPQRELMFLNWAPRAFKMREARTRAETNNTKARRNKGGTGEERNEEEREAG